MTKPRLTVRDVDGTIYFLQSRKMVEPSIDGGNRREVLRSSLKASLKTREAEYSWFHTNPNRSYTDGSDGISVGYLASGDIGYESSATFHVGCRRFNKTNAKKLIGRKEVR